MKTWINVLTAVVAGFTLMTVSQAEELTADEIVAKANDASYYTGKDGQARVKMSISDGREREFVILRKNVEGKDQNFYVYFEAPSDVRKMSYLVWKHAGGNDDRWLFLPSLNLVKRIAPGDKRTSFVGSDFLYEDVSGRSLTEDTHTLVETTDSQYVINNVPVDPNSVEFSSYKVWIDRATFLPRKAEYLDRNDKLYRRVEAVKVETIQGHPTVIESYAEDLNTGSKTVNVFSDVQYDIDLKDQIFTERFLRRPPREVLK
ncbi:MAG: outer membrane lipoprotein-sorting protein [Verrucomicrobia bacterium]|nr:outer membrane lipoprotein-sorting protein [Verrucomicrobiota bacterium]